MKIVHSRDDAVVYATHCPSCDWPLHLREHLHGGGWSWHGNDGPPVLWCPRCDNELPDRAPTLNDLNQVLAEMGEPPTCLEELERHGVSLEGAS